MGNYLDTDGVAYLAGKMDGYFARQDIVAQPFEESTTYAIGDYCIYDGTLYEAVAEHTGAWNAADFETVSIGNELETASAETDDAQEITQTVSERKMGALIDTATGSIASFVPDATVPTVKGLTVDVEPVQDLHGYDNPWPSGGGKNLLFAGAVNETRSGITFTAIGDGSSFIVSGTAKGNVALTISTGAKATNKLQSGVTYTLSGGHWANTGVAYIQLVYKGDTTGNTISIVSSASTATKTMSEDATLTGVYINFISGNTFTNDLVQPQFEIGTSATSFSPYSNICPISGWDSVEVQRTGKNLFGYSLPIHKGYWSSDSYVGDDSVVTLENATGWTNIRVPVPDGATITISGMQAQGGVYATWLRSDNPADVVSRFTNYSMNGTKTVSSGAKYLGICFSNLSTDYANYPNAQINIGSTATAYTPYQGDTYQIQLGQTVYGGTVDVINGVLTVNRAMFTFTGAENFIENTAWGAYAKLYNTGVSIMSSFRTERTISSHFKKSSGGGWSSLAPGLFMTAGGTYIGIGFDGTISDLQEYLADQYANNQPVQVVAVLATPITISLTPLEVSVLTGQTNNIWADCGDVSMEYAADLKTYIDQKIAAAASSPIVGVATVDDAIVG